MAGGDGGGCNSDCGLPDLCGRGNIAGGFRAGFSGWFRPDSSAGMALGVPAVAGGGTDPGNGSVSDMDGGGVVRDAAAYASGRTGNSAAGTGTGTETVISVQHQPQPLKGRCPDTNHPGRFPQPLTTTLHTDFAGDVRRTG